MSPKGKETARWIGIILALLVSVSGWLYASAIHVKIDRANELAATVHAHSLELKQVETKMAVLDTNITFIKQTLVEIKEMLNKDRK